MTIVYSGKLANWSHGSVARTELAVGEESCENIRRDRVGGRHVAASIRCTPDTGRSRGLPPQA